MNFNDDGDLLAQVSWQRVAHQAEVKNKNLLHSAINRLLPLQKWHPIVPRSVNMHTLVASFPLRPGITQDRRFVSLRSYFSSSSLLPTAGEINANGSENSQQAAKSL